MLLTQYTLDLTTPGRKFVDITHETTKLVANSGVATGLCHLFLHHTSASLVICENADPLVQGDMERFMQRLIPDGDAICQHIDEGPDDMPAHVRTILTQTFLAIPITDRQLGLGRWQGIYLWEHRLRSHQRKITITIQGK
jgi:secondary thiamine-phosphate synthase enzyme